MSDETHVLESLPAYAIGSLDQAEAQQVAEHLAACTLCREELAAYQSVADRLALTASSTNISPSPEIKRRLMDQLHGEDLKRPISKPWNLSRLLPVGGVLALLALLVIAALAVSNLLLWQRLENLEVLSGPRGMRAIALQSTDAAPQASGFMIVGADGRNGVLVVDQMPPLEAGHEYQLWLRRNGQETSGGVFDVDESGYRGLRVQAPQSLLSYASCRVTVEPSGGSVSPTGEEVLGGSLFNP
jgi:anti-sigma-K factor RskA